MAKRRNDAAPAEDYIDQLEWKARHARGVSVRFEPNGIVFGPILIILSFAVRDASKDINDRSDDSD